MLIGVFTSCQKSLEVQDDVYYSSDDYEEINDIEDDSEEKEPFELEERAPTFKIYSVEMLNPNEIVPTRECMRFAEYGMIDIWQGGWFKIKGIGFGNNKDSLTLTASYKTGINFPVIKSVVTDTQMVVNVTKFTSLAYPVLKNLNVKFIASKQILGITKTAKKSMKCTSWYPNHHEYVNLDSTQKAIYPNSFWEVIFQFESQAMPKGLLNTIYAAKETISTAWIPEVGDVVQRSSLPEQWGFVKEVYPVDSKGRIKLKIWERNYKCKGGIQKKTYYFKDGGFLVNRYSEPNFTHFYRQVSL